MIIRHISNAFRRQDWVTLTERLKSARNCRMLETLLAAGTGAKADKGILSGGGYLSRLNTML
jgi:hypothetical protein